MLILSLDYGNPFEKAFPGRLPLREDVKGLNFKYPRSERIGHFQMSLPDPRGPMAEAYVFIREYEKRANMRFGLFGLSWG